MDCLGCRITNRVEPDLNIIYEDDHVVCVLDIDPFNEGHTLVLPKVHYHELEEIDQRTLAVITDVTVKISKVLKKLFNPDGITICQNGGVFNDLTHYHVHIIPRYMGDGFSWTEPIVEHNANTRFEATKLKIMNELNDSCIP